MADIHGPSASLAGKSTTQTTEINQVTYTMQENDVRLKLNVIDTPGYGDYVNNDYCWEPITRYVKDQYALYLRKELSPSRDKRIADTRVHCVLYFIAPTGHSLKPIDIITMKKLGDIANVVPVIAKADSLTIDERLGFKKRIQSELQFHGISTFPHLSMADDETDLERDMKQKVLNMIPFAIVGSESTVSVDGKSMRVRKCKSGLVVVEDPAHCDFVHLQNFLIRTHMQALIETTALVHYENFRTRQLLALKEASKSTH